MPKKWESLFPQLGGNYIESSPETTDYNCAAFAAGDTNQWWDPQPGGDEYYWPDGIERNYQAETYVKVFQTERYEVCADDTLETDVEKIAIYANQFGGFEHVARQLPDGRWTSKIAGDEDIIHDTLALLAGGDYGNPTIYMARPRMKNGKGN